MKYWLEVLDWRSLAVLRRNALVYLRNWRTAFFPPAMEPVVFFLAFGLGLQGYVGELNYRGATISYATYVAPGLIAYTAFGTPFYESLYSAYVRMFYQKTWDGILATQVELPHLVWGEILWAGVRGFMNSAIVCGVLAVFDLLGWVELRLAWLPALPFLGMLAGFCFSAFGLIFTAIVPSIDHMNYPVFLIGMPISLISNTYFPLEPQQAWLRTVMLLNPVYHLAETSRGLLVHGDPGGHLLWLVGVTSVGLLLFFSIAHHFTRRRMLG